MSRIVAVSNRVTVPKRVVAAGGLAVGVLASMKAQGGLWFGWSGDTVRGEPGPLHEVVRQGITFATVDIPRADHEPYYGGFCNGALWPLFHYFVGSMRYSEQHYDAYRRVNQLFADRLSPLLEQDDLVWVHDYHLIPLAEDLRRLGHRQPMGFFLHIPFPHVEALRSLPVYADIVRNLARYDLVGFQTQPDLDSFGSAVADVLGPDALLADGSVRYGTHRCRTGVFPIGVDVDEIQRESQRALRSESVKRMYRGLHGRRCIIGVDRLDYSKGLVDRFQAYQRYMETHPESHDRVTFLQIAPLSRADVRAYAELRQSLEQAAGRINGRFAEPDWTPIRYLNRNYSHEVLMGFMRHSDACVVTPVRDGMNLVAKEYVAAQDPEDPGVLILSTLAGAAQELRSALLVNPRDIGGVAQAIQTALELPLDERRERHAEMLEVLRRNDIHAWHTRFIRQLEAAAQPRGIAGDVLRAAGSR
jgi:trehalose 6-phosphate synthase